MRTFHRQQTLANANTARPTRVWKRWCGWALLFLPVMAFGEQSALNLQPPPGDYSVIFLGNIFGIIEGVLHGTGSQILGNMFAMLNSAIMAVGGILIMYTLIVGTMNTAHEGQFLGQKWASLWVPVRSVFGLSLLVPQASGYCMMQVVVMWIIVQGVGAADKVWNVALSYLGRGGVIIASQAPIDVKTMVNGGANAVLGKGAAMILEGQVCMLALQVLLQALHDEGTKDKTSTDSICHEPTNPAVQTFCDTAVPDLLSTVNMVKTEQNGVSKNIAAFGRMPTGSIVNMPDFRDNPKYEAIIKSGVCGSIQWNVFQAARSSSTTTRAAEGGMSESDLETIRLSRAIAIQQMYADLATVARIIIHNNPSFYPKTGGSPIQSSPGIAYSQFGVPMTAAGTPCTSVGDGCIGWGASPTYSTAPLFNGTEILGALEDYKGVMAPTLRLLGLFAKRKSTFAGASFIHNAKQQGWIMAGSYFFYLAELNANISSQAAADEGDIGLGDSKGPDMTQLKAVLEVAGQGVATEALCPTNSKGLCELLKLASPWVSALKTLPALMDADGGVRLSIGNNSSVNLADLTGIKSMTILGFVNNSFAVQKPGQPGMSGPKFSVKTNLTMPDMTFDLPDIAYGGGCGWLFWIACLGSLLFQLIAKFIVMPVLNLLFGLVISFVNDMILLMISLPLQSYGSIFLAAVSYIQNPHINPIIALATMGVMLVNVSMTMWLFIPMQMLAMLLSTLGFGFLILGPFLPIIMPLIMAWMATMIGIGFIDAYYVPFLPYMIFTFGSIGWLMAVIEAMVAAPIVALGACFPEGNEAFGKSEAAIMILLNVFLRPAMMIMGYISAIILSFVSVWILNMGFGNILRFIQGPPPDGNVHFLESSSEALGMETPAMQPSLDKGYPGWAGIFGFFFPILMYTSLYLTVVQESFNLIAILPDKVLRWVGAAAESIGAESAKWAEQSKGKMEEGGKESLKASGAANKYLEEKLQSMTKKVAQGGPSAAGS